MKFMNVIFGLVILSLAACSSSTPNGNLTSSGFSCLASGTVTSGNASLPNTSVTLSNVAVTIVGGTGSNYSITLPNGTTVSSTSSYYTYPSTMTLTTGASGGISSLVSVADTTNSLNTSCTLSAGGATTGTGAFTVTASPSVNPTVGSTVTLTVSAPNILNPVFSFANSTTQSGVTVYGSGTTGFVTSSVAATVNVVVTLVSNSSGLATQTQNITLYFGTNGGTTGTLNCYASYSNYSNHMIRFDVTSYTGEYLSVTNVATADYPATPVTVGAAYPLAPSFYLQYSFGGSKNVTIQAQSASNPGLVCNLISGTVYVY